MVHPATFWRDSLQLLSDAANQIHITVNGETTIHYATPSGLARTGVFFTMTSHSLQNPLSTSPQALLSPSCEDQRG